MHSFISQPAGRARRFAAASIVALVVGSGAARAAEPPLKVCADPDNLPFSSSAGSPRGFYVDLADRLAQALGRSPEQVWQLTYLGKRAVRSSLLAHRCDLFIGLPGERDFMKQQLIMTRPFAVFRYALVLPLGSSVQALSDLRGRRVAVQLASPPQTLLANVEGVRSVTVLSPEEGMRALADGRADAAYLWGALRNRPILGPLPTTMETTARIPRGATGFTEPVPTTGLSIMPEGLEKQIDVGQMTDLLAYLMKAS